MDGGNGANRVTAAVDRALASQVHSGSTIVVGLSGGRDSVALFDATLARAHDRALDIVAVHVHHALSPHADDWAQFCAVLCAARGVQLLERRVEVPRLPRTSLEATARHARYAALADAAVHKQLGAHGWDRVRVGALGSRLARVTFFDGPRIRALAAVDAHRRVEHTQIYAPGAPLYGSSLSDAPWLLALLALGFVLAAGSLPLLSLRNLDMLALLGLTVPILASDHQLLELSVLSGYVPLAYLCWRLVRRATGAGPPGRNGI